MPGHGTKPPNKSGGENKRADKANELANSLIVTLETEDGKPLALDVKFDKMANWFINNLAELKVENEQLKTSIEDLTNEVRQK